MALRRFTEYIVEGKTYYKQMREQGQAERRAQKIADESGRPYRMQILSGWIEEDPSGFVYDSEVTSEKVKVFRPYKGRHGSDNRRTRRRNGPSEASELFALMRERSEPHIRNQYDSIIANLDRKIAKGTYDSRLAPKIWFYLANTAAQVYTKRYGLPRSHGTYGPFTVADRKEAADKMHRHFEQQEGGVRSNPVITRQWQPAQVRINDKGQVQLKLPLRRRNPKSRRLGGGGKFASCVRKVSARGGAYDPKAVCAAAGMRKYGKRRMASWAAAGRRRAARKNYRRVRYN